MSQLDSVFDQWEGQGVKRVRFEMPDLHGVSRTKIVPLAAARRFAAHGLNMYAGTAVLDSASEVAPGSLYHAETQYGDSLLFPDPDTASPVPWAPDTARLICDAQWYDGRALEAAPRAVYRRVLEKAHAMGYEPLTGCEFEFYLLDGETRKQLFHGPHQFNVVRNEWTPTITRIVDLMEGIGLEIITASCEYGGSQFEINFAPGRGLAGPDNAFTFKNGVKQIAFLDGYLATFMTKPFPGQAGNGCHIHMSLLDRDTGRNVMGDAANAQGLSQAGLSFVAGVLKYAKATDALLNPTINCRRRRRAHTFAPTNISWGLEDRSAMVRVKAGDPESTRLETRSSTGMSNPYLASAAILASGLAGIEQGLEPPAPSVAGYPAEDDASLEKLPLTLEEALGHFESDPDTTGFFGQEFKEAMLAVRRHELSRFADHITDWETNEYLELY